MRSTEALHGRREAGHGHPGPVRGPYRAHTAPRRRCSPARPPTSGPSTAPSTSTPRMATACTQQRPSGRPGGLTPPPALGHHPMIVPKQPTMKGASSAARGSQALHLRGTTQHTAVNDTHRGAGTQDMGRGVERALAVQAGAHGHGATARCACAHRQCAGSAQGMHDTLMILTSRPAMVKEHELGRALELVRMLGIKNLRCGGVVG